MNEAYRKTIIRNNDDEGGRERVTTDEWMF